MNRIHPLIQKLASVAPKAAPLAILLVLPHIAFAQVEWPTAQLNVHHTHSAWKGGTLDEAMAHSIAKLTLPMSTFTHTATKDGKQYTSTIVGTNPFDPSSWSGGAPINAVVVPLVFTGSVTFDPTAGDSCDTVSALDRFMRSPLVQNVPLTIEGQFVGNTQFVNGFRRAEFWRTIQGSSAYQNSINIKQLLFPLQINGAPINDLPVTNSSGCSTTLGRLQGDLQSFIEGTIIPSLQSNHAIDPTSFVIFLLHNVVQWDGSNGYKPGFHGAVGSPVQTYAVVDWDTTSYFPGAADGSIASHEIAEWMDDPLGTNTTPAWGGLGQVSSGTCVNSWEAGDPLTGKLMPPITVPGDPSNYAYHMQELAFFSFYFNSPTDPSVGASYYIYKLGTFSLNGTFLATANACPSGGLAPFGGKW